MTTPEKNAVADEFDDKVQVCLGIERPPMTAVAHEQALSQEVYETFLHMRNSAQGVQGLRARLNTATIAHRLRSTGLDVAHIDRELVRLRDEINHVYGQLATLITAKQDRILFPD